MRYLFALLALGLLIAVHEFGHLLAARALGIRVVKFSFGLGPAIVGFRRREIEWVLGAIPFGGYVRIRGLNPHEEGAGEPTSFSARPWWQREIVLIAGSLLNFFVALLVLSALFMDGTHVPVPMEIGTVEPGSAAARAQLRPGDVVHSVDGNSVAEWGDLVAIVTDSPGTALRLEISREKTRLVVPVTPRADGGVGRLGITQQYVHRRHTLGEAIPLALRTAGGILEDGVETFWRLVRGRAGVELESPVLIVKQASDAASLGFDAFLRVLVHLSLALGAFHLIPFPALDGGRMAFVAIEAATGRRVNPKIETALHALGFVLLVALILAIAV